MRKNRQEVGNELDMDLELARTVIEDYVDRNDTIRGYVDWEDLEDDPNGWTLLAKSEDGEAYEFEVYVDYANKCINTFLGRDLFLRREVYNSRQELIASILRHDASDWEALSLGEIMDLKWFSWRIKFIIKHKGPEAGRRYMLKKYPKEMRG